MKLKNFKLFTAILSLSFISFAYTMENSQHIAHNQSTAMGIENTLIGPLIKSNNIKAVKSLLTNGIDINFKAEDGTTLLMLAVKKANIDMVRLLLAHKADIFIQDNNNQTALDIAKRKNLSEILNLLDNVAVNSIVEIDDTEFDQETDIDSQAEISTDEDDVAISSDLLLSKKRKQPAAKFTKEKHLKTNPNLTEHSLDKTNNIIIHELIAFNKLETIKSLLSQSRVDTNFTDNNGITCLMLAVRYNLINIVRVLLEHEANIDTQDNLGNTALMLAVEQENIDIVHFLLSHNANIFIKNKNNQTARDIATRKNCIEILNLLDESFTRSIQNLYCTESLEIYATAAENTEKNRNLNKEQESNDIQEPYICKQCDYKTDKVSSLKMHITKVHTKEKPYKCDQCSLAFAFESHLTRHIKTHIGEKLYKCNQCGHTTARKWNLNEHIRAIHIKEKYTCDKCNFDAITKTRLREHIKRVHNR